MAAEKRGGNPRPLGDLVGSVVDPLLRKRAGISLILLQAWEEIAGQRLAAVTRPQKIAWPRRLSEDDPFRAGQLVVACEAVAALRLQHEAGELIGRVNALLGFEAVDRIRILQKPVNSAPPQRAVPRRLTEAEEALVHRRTANVDDPGLRESLEALGRSVLAAKKVR